MDRNAHKRPLWKRAIYALPVIYDLMIANCSLRHRKEWQSVDNKAKRTFFSHRRIYQYDCQTCGRQWRKIGSPVKRNKTTKI